jgi:hypothetical protein
MLFSCKNKLSLHDVSMECPTDSIMMAAVVTGRYLDMLNISIYPSVIKFYSGSRPIFTP